MARIQGASASAGLTQAGRLAASEIGSWIADIQKSTASALSVAEMRLVKMNDDA